MNSNSKRLIVIACGGTGGHLTPGIALANALRAAGADALLLVSAKAIDKTLLEKYPELDARPAPGSGFVNPLRNPLGFVKFCAGALGGFLLGRRLLRERRPVAFVSFGGFLTTGPALAFRMARLPVVLHEANRVPGKAVRLLSKIATQVWLPPDVEMRGLRAGVARYAGFPLRPEIKAMDKAAARRALGFPEDGPLLLVTGGSQGAATLNNWTLANAAALAAAGVHLLCVTGPKNNVETPSLQTPPAPPAAPPAASAPVHRFIPFCSQMPEALSAADVVVARAGAGSIAEFVACAVPPVLVPLPTAKDDHQTANARHLEKLGGALVIPQSQIRTDAPATCPLSAAVLRLLADATARDALRETLRTNQPRFAWQPFADAVIALTLTTKDTLRAPIKSAHN